MLELTLNPDLDRDALAREYAARRRVRIAPLLVDSTARALHGQIVARQDWRQMYIGADGIVELGREERSALPADQVAAIDRQIHDRASLGFQYRYEGLRVPAADEAAADDGLAAFARLMASAAMLEFLEQVTGAPPLAFGEAMVTAYAPGDFLTCHDDAVAGRDRLSAFVLGMTPQWRPEWGGLLMFHADDDASADALVPRFNTLDLFAVPQRHSVSYVQPSALGRRLALTGWLRPAVQSDRYS